MSRPARNPRRRDREGIALLMVILVLAILLALALPFLLSVASLGRAARNRLADQRAGRVSISLRDGLLRRAGATDPDLDLVPARGRPGLVDVPAEFPRWERPEGEGGALLAAARQEWGGETWDTQSRICTEGAGPLVYGNVLGWATVIDQPVEDVATEIPVSHTEGFADQGFLWILGELVRYEGRTPRSFTGCTRGVGWEEGQVGRWRQPGSYTVGAPVLDVRAWHLATYPVIRTGRKAWQPWSAFGEMAAIAREGHGGLSPADLARLRQVMTIRSSRRFSPAWVDPQRVLRVETADDGRCLLYLPEPRYFNRGGLVRIRGGGREEYAVVASSHNAGGQRLEVLSTGGALVLEEPTLHSWPPEEAVVELLAPVPVNLNTAGEAVLACLFAHLRPTRNLHSQAQAAGSDQPGMAKDWVSREEARNLARMVAELRDPAAGPEAGPFSGPKELVDRFLARMLAGGFLEVNPQLLAAIYRNVLHSSDRAVTLGTSPLTWWSGPVVGYRAGVALLQESGVELSRSERSGFAFVRPEGLPLRVVLAAQAEFDEALRLSRGARGWITLPNNTSFLDGRNDPPSRFAPHTWSILAARTTEDPEFDAARYFPLESEEASGLAPAPARLDPPRMRDGPEIRHLDKEPDPEGRDVGRRPFLTDFRREGQGAAAQGGDLAAPFQAAFWFKPRRGGSMTLFDVGAGTVDRDRVHLVVDGAEIKLEVLDRAGLDPGRTTLNPARTAAAIRLPLGEYPWQDETWYHLRLQVLGDSPERISLLVDGVPRGRRAFLTRLTGGVPAFDQGNPSERELDLQVEDTEGFPPAATVRIGTELFEYTSLSKTSLRCRRLDSRGGRDARHAGWEWNPEARSAPAETEEAKPVPAPAHEAGESVVLYGYSLPLQELRNVPPLSLSLPSELGPWGVARMVNQEASISVGNLSLGKGIDERFQGDLELAAPAAGTTQGGTDFMGAFQKEGGYALLCQRMLVVQSLRQGGQGSEETKVVGGVVVVYYTAMKGTKLTGVRLGGTLPLLDSGSLDPPGAAAAASGVPGLPAYYDGQTRPFVGQWADKRMEERSTNWAFVVPISLKVDGQVRLLPDPQRTGSSEYVQILPARQVNTEWVRYDVILQNALLRTRPRAVRGLLQDMGIYYVNAVNTLSWPPPEVEILLKEVAAGRADEIGWIEPNTLPLNFWAGRRLRFRGPWETGTSTHRHAAATPVLPVSRFLDRWGPMAALFGRPGRLDRVALVEGTQTFRNVGGSGGPLVEWCTINWTCRIHAYNDQDPAIPGPQYPTNLVAFTEETANVFLQGDLGMAGGGQGGTQAQASRYDRREVTRLVKFPSGEMPWKFRGRVHFGMPQAQEGFPADGLLDEVEIGPAGDPYPNLAAQLLLAFPMTEKGGGRLQLRPDLAFPGEVVGFRNFRQMIPASGALLQIGDELVAVKEVAEDGAVTIAEGGRGVLGTTATGHGMWEHVTVLERPAATTLTTGVDAGSPILPVVRADRFPLDRGLALIDAELIHYVYCRRYLSLEMPARQAVPGREAAPGQEGEGRFKAGDGLFRGRFGTVPEPHPAGAPVLEFPCRFWDTWAERADAPEMHHYDLHLPSPRALFRSVTWQEELPDPHVDLLALVRVDGLVDWRERPWSDQDREVPRSRGFFLFDSPAADEKPRALDLQGNFLDIRFHAVYRPGAFDPLRFLAQAWKRAPVLRRLEVGYEAPVVILEEQEAGR